MILPTISPDAVTLLLSGASGGLLRGLVVLRSKLLAAGGFTSAAFINLGIDMATSIVIGALFAVGGSKITVSVVGPLLALTGNTIDWSTSLWTTGFVSGVVGIALATALMEVTGNLKFLKPPGGGTP